MKDFMLNEAGDIDIKNDDLFIGVSDNQQKERLLLTEKGNVKQYPEAGVGVLKFLESEDPANLIREIGIQFTADGMKVKGLRLDNGKINVDASYEDS
jgi:hypothetical protein